MKNNPLKPEPITRPSLPRAMRYGSASILALVNAIMLAGTARAADAPNTSSNGSGGTNPSTPPNKATPAKPAGAAAKPATTGAAKPTQMNTIVVTAQQEGSYQATTASSPFYTQPLLDTPETITVVPHEVIKDQNATTLRDVLRNVPGISFQAGEASSTVAGDNLSIRGFNARNDMFIDGIRDTGIYTRDPFNTEDVEVVKGPASAYEGYGETGGSVNLVSKTPQLTPDYEFSGGVGTNAYNRETLDINQPIKEFGDTGMAFRLNAFQQYNEVANRDFVNDGRRGFAPSLAFGIGTPTRVTLSYLYQRESDLPDYGFPFVNQAAINAKSFPQSDLNKLAPLPYSNWYGLLYRDHESAITNMPTLTIEHDFDDIKLINQTRYDRTSFYAYNISARFDNPPPATTPPLTQGMITREPSARNDLDTLVDNKTFVTIPFETWKIPHTLVTSLELSRETEAFSTASGPFVDTNLYDPNAYASYTSPMKWTDENTNFLEDIAVSAFDTIKFTPQWELTGGVRYDHLYTSYDDPGPLTPSYFSQVNNLFSWRAALVYKPVPYGSFYAGYGTSFNPSIQGTSDGASNDALAANTANLPPEEDISYEIGTKWDLLDEKLSLTAALFRTDKTNARVVDPTEPGTVYELAGKQRVQGVEFDVAGSLTHDWKIFGGYVYMPSDVLSGPPSSYPGNTLPNTPVQSASLWTTYDLPCGFTVGTGGQFVDQRYALVNDVNSVPGYWTQQAMVAYKVSKNVDVQLNVYNLWDKEYIDLVGAHQAVPGAGRTLVFTTSFKF
ncbi:MAG: TonB-dependent siderophore receptor [Methylacidiphilales bacterium]|nr:TonB-dependent siderophore receptor [Candidatus Methylacidiphilales bacterium]